MARQLADGVWVLDLGVVPPLASNAYLLDDTDGDPLGNSGETDEDHDQGEAGVTLVDTGLFVNRNSIRSELAAAGYGVADLDRVLVTHYDLDHVGGLGSIAEEFTGPVYVGDEDLRLVNGGAVSNSLHHKALFHRVARRFVSFPDTVTVEPVTDGDRIGRFTAYHTPGHNPGHMVYVHDAGVAFLGDLVWEEEGELTPPFWLDSYDMREVRESIRRFADRAPAFELACMGHGTPLASDGDDALARLVERLAR